MLPAVTGDSAGFWTGGKDGELRVHRCGECGHWFHPPAPACFRCRSRDVGPEPVSGRATVDSFTVNHHAWFEGFAPPYVIAVVALEEEPDVRLTTNIVGCAIEEVRIGLPVAVEFEEWEDVWVPVFRPVTSP